MTEALEAFSTEGLLPLRVSISGDDSMPLVEVIICDGISGGTEFKNNMPLHLSLVRRLADGKEYRARYRQI